MHEQRYLMKRSNRWQLLTKEQKNLEEAFTKTAMKVSKKYTDVMQTIGASVRLVAGACGLWLVRLCGLWPIPLCGLLLVRMSCGRMFVVCGW